MTELVCPLTKCHFGSGCLANVSFFKKRLFFCSVFVQCLAQCGLVQCPGLYTRAMGINNDDDNQQCNSTT